METAQFTHSKDVLSLKREIHVIVCFAISSPHLHRCMLLTRKKVMVLSRLEGPFLVRFIDTIRRTSCHVVLVATALGYNQSLNEKNYDDLGARIRAIYSTIVDPPPVLTITGISQLVPFLQTIDPDLIISFFFPYQLTKSFLAHRSIKINMHPSPLPLYRGINGICHALLQQLSSWAITWHYITEEYDTGNVLVQESFPVQSPCGHANLFGALPESMLFETLRKAIEMSLSGHPGTPQRQPTADEEPFVDPIPLTIAQRTITSAMTCQQVWILVEACKLSAPALLQVEERLYHVIEARRLETPLSSPLTLGEVRRVVNRHIQQCIDGQMEYVVRII